MPHGHGDGFKGAVSGLWYDHLGWLFDHSGTTEHTQSARDLHEDRGMRLPEAIVAIGVTGEFPEAGAYYDVIHATDRDMHLRPDPSTAR